MDQTRAWKQFEEKTVRPAFVRSMRETEAVYQREKAHVCERLIPAFERALGRQREPEGNFPWSLLAFELLRTELLTGRALYRIMAYGEGWYLEEGVRVGELDASVIYRPYHDLEEHLIDEAKRYVGAIPLLEVKAHVSRLLPAYEEFGRELIRYGMGEAVESEALRGLKKGEEFQIRVGECLEPGTRIYMEKKNQERETVWKWLGKQEEGAYCGWDFRGLDLSGRTLTGYDFRYADFTASNLEGADLSLCLFMGARLRRSVLRGARLIGNRLHGADLREADLREANLDYSQMWDGAERFGRTRLAGWPEGRFGGADLRGASLRRCEYQGVDFMGAEVEGTDFGESELWGCRFSRNQAEAAGLTEEQRRQIVVKETEGR